MLVLGHIKSIILLAGRFVVCQVTLRKLMPLSCFDSVLVKHGAKKVTEIRVECSHMVKMITEVWPFVIPVM